MTYDQGNNMMMATKDFGLRGVTIRVFIVENHMQRPQETCYVEAENPYSFMNFQRINFLLMLLIGWSKTTNSAVFHRPL